MSYKSPIHLFETNPIIDKIRDEADSFIFRAVQNVCVDIDKEELIKALRYDRHQYEKGFAEGFAECKNTICKNCRRVAEEYDAEKYDLHSLCTHCPVHTAINADK